MSTSGRTSNSTTLRIPCWLVSELPSSCLVEPGDVDSEQVHRGQCRPQVGQQAAHVRPGSPGPRIRRATSARTLQIVSSISATNSAEDKEPKSVMESAGAPNRVSNTDVTG
jgi:hypothetical protein